MNDLLTAESILFGLVVALFGAWYPSIKSITELSIPRHPADRKPFFDKTIDTIQSKVIPILLLLFITSAIFLPDSIRIIIGTIGILQKDGISDYLQGYEAVYTAYVFFNFLLVLLSIYSFVLLLKMLKKKKDLFVI